jgi:DNA mismatch endonuclease (patch repair protein)
MVDVLTSEQRHLNMSRIRSADTVPEMLLRCALHRRGIRYRLHRKDLPGCPDITLPKYKSVIFINGCFWHGHECAMFKLPATRREFWETKIQKNRKRDMRALSALISDGWRTFVLWECAIRGPARRPLDTIVGEIIFWLEGVEPSGVLPCDGQNQHYGCVEERKGKKPHCKTQDAGC